MARTKRVGSRSTTKRDAGAASYYFARLTELEDDPLGAALIVQYFGTLGWRTAPLIEQEACLTRIEGKIQGGWTLDASGRISVPDVSEEAAAKTRNELWGPTS